MDASTAGPFSFEEWASSSLRTCQAGAQVALELAIRQNGSAMRALRERFSPPWSGEDRFVSQIAGSAWDGTLAGCKLWLDLADEQNCLASAAVRHLSPAFDQFWAQPSNFFGAWIDLQRGIISAAEKQTGSRSAAASGKRPGWISALAEVVRATIDAWGAPRQAAQRSGDDFRGDWLDVARESVHSILRMQNNLLDVVRRQLDVSLKSAQRAMNFRLSLPDLAGMAIAAEVALLHAAPVYYGLGAPRGNGAAVILIPGFMGTDLYLADLYAWLQRLGYRPYFSRIGLNAECPNLLIQNRLDATIDEALRETGTRVHLIGHSLGGLIARSVAAKRPEDTASVITLATPLRSDAVGSDLLRAAEFVRKHILLEHGEHVLPECYTGRCSCPFASRLRTKLPSGIAQTAVYTRTDRVVDWRACTLGLRGADFEVPGTHAGLAFNPVAYGVIAARLHACAQARRRPRPKTAAKPK